MIDDLSLCQVAGVDFNDVESHGSATRVCEVLCGSKIPVSENP